MEAAAIGNGLDVDACCQLRANCVEEGHHRALCDARAAGHLLNLINSKRIDEMGEAAAEEKAA
jgi:hypothetical protein